MNQNGVCNFNQNHVCFRSVREWRVTVMDQESTVVYTAM